jgi:serine/threonine protein kinase/class 3 adenylate cyclase/CHASE2 domain-containing sensor protein
MAGERKDFSDSEVAAAFHFADWQAGQDPWQPPSIAELEELIPGYRIEGLIGRGGMGAVYRALQLNLKRHVALKLFPAELGERDPTLLDRFVHEARTLARLSHPNIVTVFDAGKTPLGHFYFVMELIEGTDVARRLAQEIRLSPRDARSICLRVCDALNAAHELGIIHRDIKPANVLLNAKGSVKVADFGLAMLAGRPSRDLTLTGYVVGTPDYTAPEAHLAGIELDGRADLYAVGVMLYQMLTGSVPRGAFPPASRQVPGIDPRFDRVITRAMQTERDDRYPSAPSLRHDLEQLSVVESRTKSRETSVAVPVGRLTAERANHPPEAIPEVAPGWESGPSPQAPSQLPAPTRRKPRRSSERPVRWLTSLLAVALAALAGHLCLLRLGQGMVSLSYDLPFLFHRPGGSDGACIVYLDQAQGGRLDRSLQAPLLDALGAAGVRAVAYDLIFDAPWPDPAVDAAFAESIRRFRASGGVVMLAAGREHGQAAGMAFERILPPIDLLREAADDIGIVPLIHDDRYVVRELSTGTPDEASLTWKLALRLGAPLDERIRLEPRWINYAGPPPHPARPDDAPSILSVPAQSLLEGKDALDPSLLRGRVVIVGGRPGVIGPKLGEDLFSTPFHRLDRRGNLGLMSGAEIQTNLLLNLLNGHWLRKSGHGSDQLLVSLVALTAGIALSRMKPVAGLFAALLAGLVFLIGGVLSIHYGNLWFPWTVVALVQLPVAFIGGTITNYQVERFFRKRLDADQKRLREAFSRYVSPKMLDRISDEGFQLDPGGEKTNAAMMFTDIESFTTACENAPDPLLIVEHLNDYFERTTNHIFEQEGIVIKFIGDAIFAAWGVPFQDEGAVLKSVRAAWKLHLDATFRIGGETLHTRVGLHFGEVVAGNIGSTKHVDYTLIGDAVNVTARLEQLNKTLGTSILVSEEIARSVAGEFLTRRIGQFRVKGRRDFNVVHELLGPKASSFRPDWVDLYEEAVACYEKGDRETARNLFQRADLGRLDGDGPSRFFLETMDRADSRESGVLEMGER